MENNQTKTVFERDEEVVAVLGEALLVRVNGRLELRGGSMADRTELLEWTATTMPEEKIRVRQH